MFINVTAFEALEKVKGHKNFCLKPCLVLQRLQSEPRPNRRCLPSTRPSYADPERNFWEGHSPLRFSVLRFESVANT